MLFLRPFAIVFAILFTFHYIIYIYKFIFLNILPERMWCFHETFLFEEWDINVTGCIFRHYLVFVAEYTFFYEFVTGPM